MLLRLLFDLRLERSSVDLIHLLDLLSLDLMLLHHLVQLVLYHPPILFQLISLLFLLEVPQLDLLRVVLARLLDLAVAHLLHGYLLLRSETHVDGLQLFTLLPTLCETLSFTLLMLNLLLLVVLEHRLIHQHVHVPLQ